MRKKKKKKQRILMRELEEWRLKTPQPATTLTTQLEQDDTRVNYCIKEASIESIEFHV
jgi:hypothetical protein